ncbi:MAG: hypothetical protein GC164_11455 [Phycisphaera sp.]|nr:hypothetical protein [Phycisphaera sp.]
MNTATDIQVRPASSRGRTQIGWLDSWHSFSFGRYYDPENTGFSCLRVINDDYIKPGAGFGEHGHDNMEIITWVLSGAVKHGDSLKNLQTLNVGEVQVMSAGSGIRHSEFNASKTDELHLLQVWIEPDRQGVTPHYQQKPFDAAARKNQWDTLVSPDGRGSSLPIHQDAVLRVADLEPGASVSAVNAVGRSAYVHVAFGQVEASGQSLTDGDALTWRDEAETLFKAAARAQLLWFDLPGR